MKFDTKTTEEKMKKSISAYSENLSTIRAGRAMLPYFRKLQLIITAFPPR